MMTEDPTVSDGRQATSPGRAGRAGSLRQVVILIVAGVLLAVAGVGIVFTVLYAVNATVRRGLDRVGTAKRIKTLDRGAFAYARDNEHRYPGQAGLGDWESNLTGSQILAACLFGYADQLDKIDSGEIEPRADWAPYEPGMLATIDGRPYTLAEVASKRKAICYYPSWSGVGVEQFEWRHNAAYTGGSPEALAGEVVDPNAPAEPGGPEYAVRSGTFILIAPGEDRTYFTDDDQRNWGAH